jgi:hypothetical protein
LHARYLATFTYRPESFVRHLTSRISTVGKIVWVSRTSFGERIAPANAVRSMTETSLSRS